MPTLKTDITVAAMVELEGRFLVVEERIRGRLVINQPAGHVEDRESLLAAVIRETREETAWLFEPQSLLGVYHWRNPDNGVTTLRFAFRGQVSDYRPQQALDHPVVRTLWLTPAELQARTNSLRPWCCAAWTTGWPASRCLSTRSPTWTSRPPGICGPSRSDNRIEFARAAQIR
jgi:8-oxo-dGTP pyrophosphatase MutT (NUDIX family)